MRFFAAIFCGVLLIPHLAMACSCMADAFGPEASQKNVAQAKYIVEGRVSFVAPANEEKAEEFKDLTSFGITVVKTLKGDGQSMLAAYANTVNSCGMTIENLKRQTFFVLYEEGEKLVMAGMCRRYISPEDQKELHRKAYSNSRALK